MRQERLKLLKDRGDEPVDIRDELRNLERLLHQLRVRYEQFFLDIQTIPPHKLHQDVKRFIYRLRRLPHKNPQMTYQLRMLERRYHTFNSYWQRVLRERENGTYSRDVFKAELHARMAQEEAFAATKQGAADKGLRDLFHTYREALQKQNGKQELNYEAFRQSLVKRAKDFKERNGGKKLTFKVVVKEGKVVVQARAR